MNIKSSFRTPSHMLTSIRSGVMVISILLSAAGMLSAQFTRLTYHDLSENGHFGREFDIYGDYVLVAEPNFTNLVHTHSGRIHIYKRGTTDWMHDGVLGNEMIKSYSHFGHDISLHNQTAVISAPGQGTGIVFAYERDATTWQESHQITLPLELHRENPHTRFGEKVELSDEWLAISAPGYLGTPDPVIRTGAVFMYKKEVSGWIFKHIILPPDMSQSTQFANDIKIENSSLLISAVKGEGGAQKSGVVYLYQLKGDTWEIDYTFINPSSRSHELFGADVDMHENTIVIGAPMHTEDDAIGPQGAAHVYQRFEDNWIRTAFLEPADGKRNDMFGSTVVTENGNIIVGAPRHDQPGKADVGKVYHYTVQNSFWSEKSSYVPANNDQQAHMHFGGNLSLHNHQLVISGHLMDNAMDDSGIAFVTKLDAITGTDPTQPDINIAIHPNPVHDWLQLSMEMASSKDVMVTIYAQDGKALMRKNYPGSQGSNLHLMDASDMAPGYYFLHVADGEKISIHKWVKV